MDATSCFAVELSIRPDADTTLEEGELEATADAVLEAVRQKAAFIAVGAVISLELTSDTIELYCNVAADGPDQLHVQVARISDVMLEAANEFEYASGTTTRLELVPA